MMRVAKITDLDGVTKHHLEAPLGSNYTLCGLTTDGDPEVIKSISYVNGYITCPECMTIIKFCKRIPIKSASTNVGIEPKEPK